MKEPEDPFPRMMAELDQAAEGMKALALPMAALFRELREQGLSIVEAAALVGAYCASMASQPSSEEEEEEPGG